MRDIIEHRRGLIALTLIVGLGFSLIPVAQESVGSAALLVGALMLAGVVPFAVGFITQLLVRFRRVPEGVWWAVAIAVVIVSRQTGQGFTLTVPGPQVASYLLSILFLAWFAILGSDSALRVRVRRGSGDSTSPE